MAHLMPHDDSPAVIRLRGHTLLCLQGFRGMGYSPEFVGNMATIHRTLSEHPDVLVEILASPDAICGACPHRQSSGCTLNGERSEEEMVAQDHVVMQRLGLKSGDCLRWEEILARIRTAVSGQDLPAICGHCRWLPLGFCREGIDRLRHPVQGL